MATVNSPIGITVENAVLEERSEDMLRCRLTARKACVDLPISMLSTADVPPPGTQVRIKLQSGVAKEIIAS